ncbi:hypothetical protein A2U01_0107334, partial [Trifolium medium]|nr:hypothetical protein [Trifolium medium]
PLGEFSSGYGHIRWWVQQNHHRIDEKKVRGAYRRIFEYERHPRKGKVQILASRVLSRGAPQRIS